MVCKQCQNCAFINDKQVQNGVADIGMGQPILIWATSSWSELPHSNPAWWSHYEM